MQRHTHIHQSCGIIGKCELGEHRMILSLYIDGMDVILFNLVFGKTNIDIDTKMIDNRQNWVLTMFCWQGYGLMAMGYALSGVLYG